MNKTELEFLTKKCSYIRSLILEEIHSIGTGHIGGSFSAVEALVVLYHKVMNIDPKDPKKQGRDRFILSKGHAGPALYAVLADKGFFPLNELQTLNKSNTNLPSHCDMNRTPGIDMTTGSLGQGISCAVGMAYASKLQKDGAYIYCMVGDGECQEGQVWEAALSASQFKLDNFICFVDYNRVQLDGSLEEIINMSPMEDKWKSFGWNVFSIDGHSLEEIHEAIIEAQKLHDKPSAIILNTVKGKGISFIESMGFKNHSMNITDEVKERALKELI
ncbi:transketolase [Clostridium polyendosporum]|uniref:Transketolase n=1 Tax=Clostridium polyendosporum TaxID=69208 RepID=A0A919VFQ0_9CLOT|nr:transketolase [Clostridium polyendosporum]GIM27721.1 transketolase [Clostridium polyendosporum]